MPKQLYESTLNTWLAEALAAQGLDAKPEYAQGGGKRLDVEVNYDAIRIALEAEIGHSSAKKTSALKDADSRLRDDLADCAIAICYPAGLQSRADLDACALLFALRIKGKTPPPAKTDWKQGALNDLVSFIGKIPDELGDPDNIANALSFALDAAVSRLSESQKISLAQKLDLLLAGLYDGINMHNQYAR